MPNKNQYFETHDFYCVKCGKKGIPISRRSGALREQGHLKSLYCIFCKEYTNHKECINDEDVRIFKEEFKEGKFMEDWYYGNISNVRPAFQSQ